MLFITSTRSLNEHNTNVYLSPEAVRRAIAHGKERGLKPGEVVAHHTDKYTYELIRIEGDKAFVERPAKKSPKGKTIEKTFPLNEIFAANDASKFVSKVQEEDILKTCPGIAVVEIEF